MQLQNHVNEIPAGYWPRCSDVTVQDGLLQWRLDLQNSYNLADKYTAQPHLHFLQSQDDEDFRKFTQKWGPLFGFDPTRPVGVTPVAWYRSFQRRLAAFVKLADSIRNKDGERDALLEFVTAEREFEELFSLKDSWPIFCLSRYLPAAKDPVAALQNVELRDVKSAAAGMIRETPMVVCSAGFDVNLSRRVPDVVARWKIDRLQDALRWMVWRDAACGQPVSRCLECSKMFRPDTKHKTKYCSYKCAHRVAARESARKQRRKGKQHPEKKGRSI